MVWRFCDASGTQPTEDTASATQLPIGFVEAYSAQGATKTRRPERHTTTASLKDMINQQRVSAGRKYVYSTLITTCSGPVAAALPVVMLS